MADAATAGSGNGGSAVEPRISVEDQQKAAVEIATKLHQEGEWRDLMVQVRSWKDAHPRKKGDPTPCTMHMVNPPTCAWLGDWNDMRSILAEGSRTAYFGFCAVCADGIERAGFKFISGGHGENVMAAIAAREEGNERAAQTARRQVTTPPSVAATPAVPAVAVAEPRVETPAPAAAPVDPIAAMDLSTVEQQFVALRSLRPSMGEPAYAATAIKLLKRRRELEDARIAAQRRRDDEELARVRAAEDAELGTLLGKAQADLPARNAGGSNVAPRDSGDRGRVIPFPTGTYNVTGLVMEVAQNAVHESRWRALCKPKRRERQDGGFDQQCLVAANRPHACDRWATWDQLKALPSSNPQVVYGFCTVCAAIARAGGVEVDKKSLAEVLQSKRPQFYVKQRSDAPLDARPATRHTGKTKRQREKQHHKKLAREAVDAARKAAQASQPAKPSKEDRRKARHGG